LSEQLLHVEIWSDIACPWCYVGKRRFEAALASFAHHDSVRVTWRSFELDPAAPRERAEDSAAHLAEKYGRTREEAMAMHENMTRVAAGDGLDFRFDRLRLGNTFDGHRLLHLAHEHDAQDAMKERLMRAYLTEGELIADVDVLIRLAAEAGLSEDETRAMLESDRFADAVREDERTAAALGITAVPFFVVNREIAVSGAQPPEVMLALLERARPQPAPLAVVADGEACGPDGC
jgi:predicted DsbA family dithiol-disulfide isomerase